MDAVKYLKEKDRATNGCVISCMDCVLGKYNEERKYYDCIQTLDYNMAVEIIEKWSKEHPRKTMLQDFLEKYPNAPLNDDGVPDACPYHLGYTKEDKCNFSFDGRFKCFDCWSRPMEE